MSIGNKQVQRVLLCYCGFTCIYFPGILTLLKLSNNIYNVGTYKFIPILLILMFAEVIKLAFSMMEREPTIIGKTDLRSGPRVKRSMGKNIKEIFKFVLSLLILCVVYYVIIVLFGAPLLTHHEETIMLAITLTALTFVPASLHLGVDTALGILTGTYTQKGNPLVDAAIINIKATLVGAWLGAIVIPLDWDRPWQAWPIPCVTGALVGYMVANFITLVKTLPLLKNHQKVHR